MIDLHLHTTASDGRCTPRELVDRAAAAGVTVMAVTDHDTTAAVAEVRALAREPGIETVSGIEITAIDDGRDVHVLGYFFDPQHAPLQDFLHRQRAARIARVEAMAARLAALGLPIDVRPAMEMAARQAGRSIGRPLLARLLVDAGHVADTREAFDRWLGRGCPAFIPRSGAAPEQVIEIVHDAGGLASLAHPGKEGLAPRIPSLVAAGLDAVEVFHPDHDARLTEDYARIARDLRVCVTGGSDFHGDPAHGLAPGSVTLPDAEWERLKKTHAR